MFADLHPHTFGLFFDFWTADTNIAVRLSRKYFDDNVDIFLLRVFCSFFVFCFTDFLSLLPLTFKPFHKALKYFGRLMLSWIPYDLHWGFLCLCPGPHCA